MNQFETHVFATVRVKVLGTNFSTDPQEIAQKVTDAVCANPSAWMQPVYGTVAVDGEGKYDIDAVEFADGIYGVLVNEINPETGHDVADHFFDETCSPKNDDAATMRVIAEVADMLKTLPQANEGNSKVHWALMRLTGLLGQA